MSQVISFKLFARILLFAISAATASTPPAHAQGAAGGSIGNDEKAVSGSRPARAVPSEKPAPRSTSRQQSRRSGGGNAFDGPWMVTGRGNAACPGAVANAVVVSNGHIDGGGAQGTVSANGTLRTVASGSGKVMITTGRLSGRGGSGTFRQNDGCAGTWTAVKQ
jgi:hypothetical protein